MAYNDVEPANGNIWELWDSPTGSDGMDSVRSLLIVAPVPMFSQRNHHMFSSPSAWHYELAGFSRIRTAGCIPILLHHAPPYCPRLCTHPLPHCRHNPRSLRRQCDHKCPCWIHCVRMAASRWHPVRQGCLSCVPFTHVDEVFKPENQGKVNPALPLHPDLVLSCGDNSVISAITFASFGLPIGYCDNFGASPLYLIAFMTCASNRLRVPHCKLDPDRRESLRWQGWRTSVEWSSHLTFLQSSCTIPSTVDFWTDPCYGFIKRLFVRVFRYSPM